jgi:hypothetical protein
MNKTHYSEADLLETYYMQPGESMPVMLHLASCADCAARYERLERKLREVAACDTERPDTFWARQRHLIMRGIASRQDNVRRAIRTARIAAAAALAFFLGGAVMYKSMEPQLRNPPVVVAASTHREPAALKNVSDDVLRDPWESDELKNFHSVVQWETWVDSTDGDEL